MRGVILFCLFAGIFLTESKLALVIHTFRHGARGPIYDAYDSKEQESIAGELVPSGMRQHYNFGRQLRKEYIDDQHFLSDTFDHNEVYIRSTDVNRTLMSAQSMFMGFYPNGANLPVDLDPQFLLPAYQGAKNYIYSESALPFYYQSLPIHTAPNDEDDLLWYPCTGEDELYERDYELYKDQLTDLEQGTSDFRQQLCIFFDSASDKCNADFIGDLWDTYISDVYQGRAVPKLTQEQRDLFSLISSFDFYTTYSGYYYARYISYPYFNDILTRIHDKIDHPDKPIKWVAYSVHDSNIVLYTNAWGLSNYECIYNTWKTGQKQANCLMQPAYTSNFMYELYEENGQYYIMTKLEGVYQKLCDDTYKCSVTDFEAKIRAFIVDDVQYKKQCQSQTAKVKLIQTMPDQVVHKSLIPAIFIVFLLVGASYLIKKNRKDTTTEIQREQLSVEFINN